MHYALYASMQFTSIPYAMRSVDIYICTMYKIKVDTKQIGTCIYNICTIL